MMFADRWTGIQSRYEKWWQGRLGRPLIGYTRPRDSGAGDSAYRFWTCTYPFDVPASRIAGEFRDWMAGSEFLGDAYPCFWPNFGPGVLAAPLGSVPDVQPDTVWFNPAPDAAIEALRIRFDPRHPWWQRIRDITTIACRELPSYVPVGFTDIGGAVDILASLIGSEALLVELHDHPEAVRARIDAITEAWLAAYRELHAIIRPHRPGTAAWAPTLWAPGTTYMLQCDFSYMISPAMFERFVLPELTRCCEALDYAFYHLDGPGELPHLPLLLKLDRLRGIQWVPGAGQPTADQWPQVLKPIVEAGKLVQAFVSVKGALKILEQFPGEHFTLTITDSDPDPWELDRLLAMAG